MAKAWGVLNFDFGRDVPLENLKSTHEYTNFLENLTHRYTKTPTFSKNVGIFLKFSRKFGSKKATYFSKELRKF
jgi:hypothetical protein